MSAAILTHVEKMLNAPTCLVPMNVAVRWVTQAIHTWFVLMWMNVSSIHVETIQNVSIFLVATNVNALKGMMAMPTLSVKEINVNMFESGQIEVEIEIEPDECFQVNVPCQENHECVENAHCVNRSCRCTEGYQALEIDCVDVNECGTPNFCGPNAVCVNSIGSYHCECKSGYEKIRPTPESHCKDINECLLEIPPCGTNALCINRNSSYECVCPDHLQGDPEVACVSPCAGIDCGSHAACRVNGREANCICDHGFTFDPTNITAGCIAFREPICVWQSFEEKMNIYLKEISTKDTIYLDVNECSNSHGPSGLCGQGAICTNALGSYQCVCPPGFTGDPFRYCEDIDECDAKYGMSGQCGDRSMCENSLGSYSCSCYPGYTGNARLRCQDINECSEVFGANGRCGLSAICTNTEGGFECRCPSGTAGDPFQECKVMIECIEDSACPGNAICMNQHCFCPSPSFGNECQHPCDEIFCVDNAKCELDLFGHPNCVCAPGYTGQSNSLSGCVDINECDASDTCGRDAVCRNIPGSYECICPQGLLGDPYIGCFPDDIAECTEIKEWSLCGPHAECINLPGSYECICDSGYTGNPKKECSFIDVNECTSNLPLDPNGPCSVGATCINTIGSFVCECPPRSSGNPYEDGCQGETSCESNEDCTGNAVCDQKGGACIDPCSSSVCGQNAYCASENHIATCICHPGFSGDPYDETKGCVSSCTGIRCSQNAHCIVSNENQVVCVCQEGFTGNPWAGGQCYPDVRCSVNQTCSPSQDCRDGVCVERCDGIQCGVNAQCDRNTGQCVCPPFFTGHSAFLCVPPTSFPICTPSCGTNAYCQYGAPNKCVCNTGYSGNPYEQCGPSQKCTNTKCGLGAQCVTGPSGADCFCPAGLQGNPFLECLDVDECLLPPSPCGIGAACINTIGSFLCVCPTGTIGNPLLECTVELNECEDDDVCSANFACKQGENGVKKCIDVCQNVVCGPAATCTDGVCKCNEGMTGDPNDLIEGCSYICKDAHCGPNALCNKNGYPPACECLPGFFGNPKDSKIGCQPPDICEDDNSCPANQLCKPDKNGVKNCFDVCERTRCGPNAECVGKDHKPECHCLPGFSGTPTDLNKGCTSVPEDKCQKNDDCSETKLCQSTESGIKDCIDVCAKRKCGPNSQCLGLGHTSICECFPGFSGIPDDLVNGCQRDICTTDNDCPASQTCERETPQKIKNCIDVCKEKQCGPNAECIASNHQAQCKCKSNFEGDGDNVIEGCKPVDKCKTNGDCPDKDICKLNQNGIKDCISACLGTPCGPNTVCAAVRHRAQCTCENGYTGDPYKLNIGCTPIPPHICDSNDACPPNAICQPSSNGIRDCYDACAEIVCGPNAQCVSTDHKHVCTCIKGFIGDPNNHTHGCIVPHQCDDDEDCDSDKVCRVDSDKVRKCVLVCVYAECGASAVCQAENHQPLCICPEGTTGNPNDSDNGCQTIPNICENDSDCIEDHVCRLNENGILDCIDACKFVSCGPNALCKPRNTEIICECEPDHEGDPYNLVNGCKPPIKDECKQDTDCASSQDLCKPDNSGIKKCVDACRFSSCGTNSECVVIDHVHRCQCKPGFVKDPTNFLACISKEPDQCKEDIQCPTFQTCKPNNLGTLKCAEICLDFTCTPNSECIAINHKGQCKCKEGFTGDPNSRSGCVH
ncbi:fibropellin-1-like [Limulus polyphemus]|uniref:Fibropellin-1-like n=1 Tax=Limulus polyphemus TaxID=6850 RepID=A0ABM1SDQ0_LIMPO|nr:fibropellin-1-like [Limulus polyphemus]